MGGSEGAVDEVEVGLEEVGVCLEESLLFVLVVTGKLKERRFKVRGVYDNARVCFTAGRGGGAIANDALFGEFPTWGLGAAAGSDGSPDFKIDSIDARSRDDFRRQWLAIVLMVCWVYQELSWSRKGEDVALWMCVSTKMSRFRRGNRLC